MVDSNGMLIAHLIDLTHQIALSKGKKKLQTEKSMLHLIKKDSNRVQLTMEEQMALAAHGKAEFERKRLARLAAKKA